MQPHHAAGIRSGRLCLLIPARLLVFINHPRRPPGSSPIPLAIGTVLGGRYKTLKLLGQDGMGAVLKAREPEVDRLVALKNIRPDMANMASALDVLARFRQKLLLSSQVTHRNVFRIFDRGEAQSVKCFRGPAPSVQTVPSRVRCCEPSNAPHLWSTSPPSPIR